MSASKRNGSAASRYRPSRYTFSALALALALVTCAARAGEPVRPLLDAMRQRQYFDDALEYLDQLRTSRLPSDEFKQSIDFEQAVTLMQEAGHTRDPALKEKLFDRAHAKLGEFLSAHPQHSMAASANSQLAGILVERGRTKVAIARGGKADNKDQLLGEAKKLLLDAQAKYASAEKDLDAQHKKFPRLVLPEETELKARKLQVGGDLAAAQFMQSSVEFELARTAEPLSPDSNKHLKAAASGFAKIVENYRMRSLGIDAHYWEGRCYQDLGDYKQALGCYRDLIDLGDSKVLANIRTSATRQALEILTDPKVHNYTEAIAIGERWTSAISIVDESDPDALAIRYLTALANQREAAALGAKDPNRKKFMTVARQNVMPVTRHPGEYQKPAKELLAKVGGSAKDKDEDREPATFAEARDRGRQALEQMQEAAMLIPPAEENKEEETLAQLRAQKKNASAQALKFFRLALALPQVDPLPEKPKGGGKGKAKDDVEDTGEPKPSKIDELNEVRYYVCFLCWDSGQYLEAAVLGEFLARHYPKTLQGRQGARIAMAAYVKLYTETKALEKDFEIEQIVRIAEFVVKQWPGEEEAADANTALLNFAIAQRNVEKILKLLDSVPADSPQRGQIALRAGQALYAGYLKSSQAPEEDRPPQAKLDELKKHAQAILEQGVAKMKQAGTVDATIVAASLSLAQIYNATNEPAKAIATLTDPDIGPLSLVKAGNAVALQEGFATETYKVALQAYIAVQPPQLKEAEEAMNSLETLVGKSGDAKAGETLTLIYISLGKELQHELQQLRTAGKTKELDSVSKGFELFLARIGKRDKGNTYSSLSWVAETFYSLANGFDDNSKTLTPQADKYYRLAIGGYERMLMAAESDPKFAPNAEALLGVRLRMSVAQRRLGLFQDAIDNLAGILVDKPLTVSAQVLAAETYQAWGATQPDSYKDAIKGARPGRDGKNIIWGWARLAKLTQSNPNLESTFHKARLKLAESRFQYGLQVKDSAVKTKTIESARQDLWFTYRTFPSLGGPESTAEYERLLKRIQKSLGEQAVGFQEFKSREASEKKDS